MAENLANDFATTLAGAVDNSTGTLTVVLASGAPAPNFRIRVDDELMLVTAVAGTTWTATRGIEGTAAASHASGAGVVHVLTAGALAALFADHAPAAADITDSTTVGRAVITAANDGAARTAMGAAPLANPSFTGDLTLSSVGARIRGDFSNATAINMVSFQSSVPDGRTVVSVLPNGASKAASFAMYNGLDPANAQRGFIGIDATRVYTGSNYSGSPGVALQYDIDVGGANRVRILPTGEVGIGVTPAIGKGTLQVPDVNGAAASGFKNKIINGCCRISRKGSGAAALGWNQIGADGISTFIGGWSAISGWTIVQAPDIQDARTSTGAIHYCALGTVTGAGGHIVYSHKIEAADAQELAGKTVTLSCRLTAWGTAIGNHYFRIYKADTKDNFSALTQITASGNFGVLPINIVTPVVFTTTLAAADCMTGLLVEIVSEYWGAIAASSYNFLGDFSLRASSQLEPFERRPIAIEEQLRERYWKVLQVWVPTSSSRAVVNIRMHKTPTISGGGTGLVSTGTDKDNLVCYQTTAALQTITLNAEL